MAAQLAQHILTLGGIVHEAYKGGAQLHIGNILGHIPAHAAVDELDLPGVSPRGEVQILRKALHIHKHRADHHNSHKRPPSPYPYLS